MHRKAFDKLDTLSALAFLSHLKTGCWTVSSHSKLSDKPNTEEQAGMIWDVKPKSRRWCIELTASIRNERIISDHQAKHSLAKVCIQQALTNESSKCRMKWKSKSTSNRKITKWRETANFLCTAKSEPWPSDQPVQTTQSAKKLNHEISGWSHRSHFPWPSQSLTCLRHFLQQA